MLTDIFSKKAKSGDKYCVFKLLEKSYFPLPSFHFHNFYPTEDVLRHGLSLSLGIGVPIYNIHRLLHYKRRNEKCQGKTIDILPSSLVFLHGLKLSTTMTHRASSAIAYVALA